MGDQDKAGELQRLSQPGILIRIDGSAEVFYIDEKSLQAFRLPACFQVGGKAETAMFHQTGPDNKEVKLGENVMTGDELQRELNKSSLFRKTNLLNAFFCFDGPFIQGEDDRVQLAETPGKSHKPITRFPSF